MNDIYYPKEHSDERGRYLPIGALAETRVTGVLTKHHIVGRRWSTTCQSGILFRLDPPIPANGGPDAWVDADWFSPGSATTVDPVGENATVAADDLAIKPGERLTLRALVIAMENRPRILDRDEAWNAERVCRVLEQLDSQGPSEVGDVIHSLLWRSVLLEDRARRCAIRVQELTNENAELRQPSSNT